MCSPRTCTCSGCSPSLWWTFRAENSSWRLALASPSRVAVIGRCCAPLSHAPNSVSWHDTVLVVAAGWPGMPSIAGTCEEAREQLEVGRCRASAAPAHRINARDGADSSSREARRVAEPSVFRAWKACSRPAIGPGPPHYAPVSSRILTPCWSRCLSRYWCPCWFQVFSPVLGRFRHFRHFRHFRRCPCDAGARSWSRCRVLIFFRPVGWCWSCSRYCGSVVLSVTVFLR